MGAKADAVVLKEGDKAPAFSGQTDQGSVKLGDYKGKTLVLYFYPKDDTPGCTVEACSFRDNIGAVRKLGTEILGVSMDPVASHAKFRDKFSLNFPLLADEQGEACKAYGAYQMKNNYGKKYWGIVRSTFVIGPDGKIQKIWPRVKADGHTAQVLEFLKSR